MATEYITPESEAHWLEMRRNDLTSTEASALFNMSPYSTRYELWHKKRGILPEDFEDNDRVQAGRHIEPAIASLVAERYGVVVEPFKRYARDVQDRMGSSFDYLVTGVTENDVTDHTLRDFFNDLGPGIIECKNVDGLVFKRKWMDDETPAHIEIQLQHQLELTRHGWGAVVALVGGNKLETYVRERNAEFGQVLRNEIRKFWRSVDEDQAPPIIYPDDAEVVISMHQFSDGSIADARGDDAIGLLCAGYDDVSAQIKALEQQKEIFKAKILDYAGDAATLLWDGGKVVLTQTKDSPGTLITADMVGTHIGGRKGYRMARSYPKPKEASSNE